ncbi:ParB N-terminal domain-containing protein [Streptomyces albus]|uniref:ParB/RepB/Spo0J family partition protein n=1 Tax=Streptomyces albus TaxID=1888 RepID=UPI0033D21C27
MDGRTSTGYRPGEPDPEEQRLCGPRGTHDEALDSLLRGGVQEAGDPEKQETVDIPVEALRSADSPRAGGEDIEHTRALAETEAPLPPILVHRQTMRVIDGMHRLRAARLRGAKTIPARFFDGDESAAFVLAVKANIAHGLPLTLADRKAAALRIVGTHPQWSDRMIAEATGLAHKTVGAIRRRLGAESPQPAARVGRDGRVRPLNSDDGRLRAGELLAQHPQATSAEIGLAAGISPTTVKDVRRRLRRGEDPLVAGRHRQEVTRSTEQPQPQPPEAPAAESGAPLGEPESDPCPPVAVRPGTTRRRRPAAAPAAPDRAAAMHRLCADPSVRFTECGRALLRWLDAGPRTTEEVATLATRMPAHHLGLIAGLARQSAALWEQFSDELERRADAQATLGG